MRRLWILLLFGPALSAGDGPPLIAIREPDPKTARDIRNLVSSKGLGSSTAKVRRDARRTLVAIGPWTLPRLTDAIGKRGAPRVRQNAVTTVTQIEDPIGLPALRKAASGDRDKWVRTTACLALGRFARRADRELLERQMAMAKEWHAPAATLAIAKLRDPVAAQRLRAQADALPARQPRLAAAAVLAAAIVNPATDCIRFLGHKEDLVRHAAILGLLVRPLGRQAEEELMRLLDRPPGAEETEIRALQFLALAKSGSEAARARLLEGGLDKRERQEVRMAALIGLGQTLGGDHFKALKREYRTINSRSDPMNAPLLYAIARTNDPDAIEFLLGVAKQSGDKLRAIYARGSLIQLSLSLADPSRVLVPISGFDNGRDTEYMPKLFALAQTLRGIQKDGARRARAKEEFALIGDPDRLRLWDWTPTDRHWDAVNRFLPLIFDLKEIAERPRVGSRKGGNQPIPKDGDSSDEGGEEAEASEGKPEHTDLLDFLRYEPYFVAEDLLGG